MTSATVPHADPLALVRAHQTELWRYLRFLGCDGAEAEDLAQETFVAVLRRPFEDRGPLSSAAYLRRVARNLLLKSRERDARRPASVPLDSEAEWQRWCGRDGGDRYLESLRECMAGVEGRGRDALGLRYGEGASRSEIAARLGLSSDGVKSLLRRVRTVLRECIERRLR